MPAFGKVHSALHTGVDRVKSGLKWAGHKYQQGMHLAGRANDLYQTGKKIAGIFNSKKNILGMMPHPERMVDKLISNTDGVNLFSSIMN